MFSGRVFDRSYFETRQRETSAQLLQILHDGRIYKPRLTLVNEKSFTEEQAWQRARGQRHQHTHAFYHLLLYTFGANRTMVEGREHDCREGMLLVVSPNAPHIVAPMLGTPFTRMELDFELFCGDDVLTLPMHELLSLFSGRALTAVDYPVMLDELAFQDLRNQFTTMLDALDRPGPVDWFHVFSLLHHVLTVLVRDVHRPTPPAIVAAPLERARYELDYRFRDQLRIEDLARLAGMSRAHFIRSFKQAFGLSPIAYQRQLRIAAAKRLLTSSELAPKEIAHEIGFANVHYFTRVFKEVTGTPPATYRRSGNQAAGDPAETG